MREVDPFDYWESHSSAIEGLGGRARSPDPRYVFHTRYHEVRPGRAQFVLSLTGARASFGELSIRLHAWKPETNSNVSLVSGARILLDGGQRAELKLPVHFASQKGVLYALYGYMSEDSDLAAQALQVSIDEPDDIGELLPEPPRSLLAMDTQPEETRPANALLHYGRTNIEHPVSQSCTTEQVAALGLVTTGIFGRERLENNDVVLTQWSETLCLNALNTYGATDSGLEGLAVGAVSADFARRLARYASVTHVEGRRPTPRASSDFYDFLLMPGGSAAIADAQSNARERWEAIEDWLMRLKVGGLAALGLRYRPDGDLVSSSGTSDAQALSRNEIGQWCLRLIGSGYSAAPIAFAPVSELVVDRRGLAGFVLIVQRL